MEQIENNPVEEMAHSSPIATPSEGGESAQQSEQTIRPPKRRRSLPGMPDPGAEVIALSPKSLLETNRFVCDICGKGFQREQNLQLHGRGHNLPWKLKLRAPDEEIKKRVYVCPEPTCAHHDPSRALGDLTGIKKHFCRKHGEKKFQCEKCNKSYAVQCDWKAHTKICGTREYPCGCGTVFPRRDSYISHRVFCVASLTVAVDTNTPSASPPPHPPTPSTLVLSPILSLHSSGVPENQSGHPQQLREMPPSISSTSGSEAFGGLLTLSGHSGKQKETGKGPACSSLDLDIGNDSEENFASVLRLSLHSGKEKETAPSTSLSLATPSVFLPTSYDSQQQQCSQPVLSATALLQKAAQMGSSSSSGSFSQGLGLSMSSAAAAHDLHDELRLSLQPARPTTEPSPAMIFNSNPPTLDFLGSRDTPTLDFLGLGQGANPSPSTEFGMASSSFGGVSGDHWDDDNADQKPPQFL